VAHTARNAQGVDAVVEEVEGGAKRKMTEEILCHDHEKSRIRNNVLNRHALRRIGRFNVSFSIIVLEGICG
jgi:hypothetical protein